MSGGAKRIAGRGVSLLWRVLTIGSQAGGIALYLQLLPVREAATYLSHLAMGTVLATFLDLGFTQYSFRYLNRRTPTSSVICSVLLANGLGLLALPFVLILLHGAASSFYQIDYAYALLAIVSLMLNNLAYVNRYACLIDGRPESCIFIDLLQPLFFAVALILLYFVVHRATVLQIFSWYALTGIAAFLASVWVAHSARDWLAGGRLALGQLRRWDRFAGLIRAMRRSAAISFELNLFTALTSILVVGFDVLRLPLAAAAYGTFQKALGVSRSLSAVVLRYRMPTFYNSKHTTALVLRFAGEGLGICAISAVASLGFVWLVHLEPSLLKIGAVRLLLASLEHWAAVGACIGTEYMYFHVSYLMLGQNQVWGRVGANLVGCVTTIAGAAIANSLGILTVAVGVEIYMLSLVAATAFMLSRAALRPGIPTADPARGLPEPIV